MTAQTSRPSPIFPVTPAHPLSPHDRHLRATATATGPLTSRSSLLQIREAVRAERTARLVLLNYEQGRLPFWILLRVSPIFSPHSAAVVHFLVVQVPLFRHRASSPVRDLAFRRCCSKEVLADSFSDFNCRSFCSCYNQLTGSIPTQLGTLRNLRVVALQSNNLTGAIPASLGDLGMLLRLDLSSNKLFGSIPISLADAPSLKVLDVQKNTLSGNVPPFAYFVGVQIEDDYKNEDGPFLSPEKRQLSVVGVVKVAVRSLSMTAGSSKS
ncbi:hypothetical protein Fmac_001947 [Flemingia macrophylla]|uniref:Uncharacterized protein n=1 Tax=Flemingia macrophylla TaxID=520843 RepID=A0ABD1NIJ7_9FABA